MNVPGGLQRVEGAVERLDLPDAHPHDVEESLDDLARLNRLFLGTRLTLRALARLLADRDGGPLELLDAGCGGGDLTAAMVRWSRGRGFTPHAVGVDASPRIAAVARHRAGAEVEIRVGDVRALDLGDGAVDVAHCSLLLHHLEPPEVVAALRELARVARAGVVVNDLVRTRFGLLGTAVVTRLLARNAITRHDGALSVRRAYTRRELLGFLGEAGLQPVWTRGALGYRVAIASVPA